MDFWKAQSAIEYLMTYGWMLLVVAIAGGSVFSIVGEQSIQSVSGFKGQNINIDNFGLTEESVVFEARNTDSNKIEIKEITVKDRKLSAKVTGGPKISVGDSKTVELCGITENFGNNDLGVRIKYDSGNLEDLEVSGTISGSLAVESKFETSYNFSCPTSASAPDSPSKILNNMDGNGSLKNPYEISNEIELQAINAGKDQNYELENNIDAQLTSQWNGGRGFKPIGDDSNPFTGSIDGKDHKIKSLTINRSYQGYTGLIGATDVTARLSNLKIENANITGSNEVGGITGFNRGKLNDVHISNGTINGDRQVGGISGQNIGNITIASSTNMSIYASRGRVGGISGLSNGQISLALTSGNHTVEDWQVSGIVGLNNNGGEINNSISTATLNNIGGSVRSGGIVGWNKDSVYNSYFAGSLNGNGGGLVGFHDGRDPNTAIIVDSYFLDEDTDDDADQEIPSSILESGDDNISVYTGSSGNSDFSLEDAKGESAKSSGIMSSLDYENVWKTVEDSYPVLRDLN